MILATIFLSKIVQLFGDILGFLKSITYLEKSTVPTLWTYFDENWATF